MSATSDGTRFFFPVAGGEGLRTPTEPECRGRDEYVDVLQRLLLYAEGSDEYAQAAVDARRLMSR